MSVLLNCTKAEKTIWGLGRMGPSNSYRLQHITAFPQGRILYKEQESLLCPHLVQDMKVIAWNSKVFLHTCTAVVVPERAWTWHLQ